MKTDKESLELAAKAAGIVGEWVDDYNPTHDYFYQGNHSGFYVGEAVGGSCTVWNPLTNDGDALRLAVKLNITFVFDVDASLQDLFARAGVGLPSGVNELVINGDKDAAARRAITRVAAMIGESK